MTGLACDVVRRKKPSYHGVVLRRSDVRQSKNALRDATPLRGAALLRSAAALRGAAALRFIGVTQSTIAPQGMTVLPAVNASVEVALLGRTVFFGRTVPMGRAVHLRVAVFPGVFIRRLGSVLRSMKDIVTVPMVRSSYLKAVARLRKDPAEVVLGPWNKDTGINPVRGPACGIGRTHHAEGTSMMLTGKTGLTDVTLDRIGAIFVDMMTGTRKISSDMAMREKDGEEFGTTTESGRERTRTNTRGTRVIDGEGMGPAR